MGKYKSISPADFFYRNKDIAGFDNPVKAMYTAFRELVENSLDACEEINVLPDIKIRLKKFKEDFYRLSVEDNGEGVPSENIPLAFGKILYGSKYLKVQSRGLFGLGGKMVILYGQITTNQPVRILSSVGGDKKTEVILRIDIKKNKPIIEEMNVYENSDNWRGTLIEVTLQGDYNRAKSRILEYLKQTAIVTPYANISFSDPEGAIYQFKRAVMKMPRRPKPIKPHPHGVDVETVRGLIEETDCENMLEFLTKNFHRVGESIAKRFLKFSGLPPNLNPKNLTSEQLVHLTYAMRDFPGFLPPDPSVLSPLGLDILKVGLQKELKPSFIALSQRPPSVYQGNPFIIEAAIAFGGNIPNRDDFTVYRFANRIPLLYDAYSDVTMKVIRKIKWERYGIKRGDPILILTHIVSTKIPFKTVGKEFIADIPEVEHELNMALLDCARQVKSYFSSIDKDRVQSKRRNILSKYLSKIIEFSAKLAEKEPLDAERIIKRVGEES
ncbi:MAG: DNA topoisomerase VI subunit B [Candidatus Odinarchaeia archaeon]